MSSPESCPKDDEIVAPKILSASSPTENEITDEPSNDENGDGLSESDINFSFEIPTEIAKRKRYIRNKLELALYQTTHRNVLIYSDSEVHQYREVLEQYEPFMGMYESQAIFWPEHFRNIRRAIDKSIGIRSNMTDAELQEVLSKVGCITLFGCGFNPTRELSKKLLKGLRQGYARLVLVDFSQKAISSSIDFLTHAGIVPGAAYQMDLTLGLVGYINSNINSLLKRSPLGIPFVEANRLCLYFALIDEMVDYIIESLNTKSLKSNLFRGYILNDEDKPGLAISSMVASATFVTVMHTLLDLISHYVPDKKLNQKLTDKAYRINAKFNASVVQLITTQMLNFCREDGKAVMITETDRIGLKEAIVPKDKPANSEWHEREKLITELRAAIESGESNPELADRLDKVSTIPVISRSGTEVEFEKAIAKTPLFDERFFVKMGRKDEWFWWDDLDPNKDPHGHRVHKITFKAEKMPYYHALDFFVAAEQEIGKQASVQELTDFAARSLGGNENVCKHPAIKWLESLTVNDFELQEGTEGHAPFAFKSMMALLATVPEQELNRGWEACLEYLQKNEGWLNDNRTKRHVQVGYKLLVDLVGAFKSLVAKEQ